MAKYERNFKGDFNHFISYLEDQVMRKSLSASFEEKSDYQLEDTKIAVRVFERYSWTGQNRVSLNVTVVEENNNIFISAITSGGSQAVFFKVNRFGERSFLDGLEEEVEKYIKKGTQ